jgi:8-oxo-dGTP pyrophosphatase MutT (NUDIX family)/GNAT superfamily N-acetyltransferase
MTDYIETLRKHIGHAPILQCGASIILVNERNEILLQKRRDNGCWGFHGGAIELDEVVEEAAKRELFEETGLTANSLELFGVFSGTDMHYVYPNGDEVSNVDIVYICRDFSGVLKAELNEVTELKFFRIDELPDNISPPQRKPLNKYVEHEKAKRAKVVLIERTMVSDLQSILDLQYLAFLSEAKKFNDFTIEPLNQKIDEIKEEFEKGIILKAKDKHSRIIGSVRGISSGGTTQIRKLIVHPTVQNQGIGTKLIAAIENECFAARYELSASIRCPLNIKLYERLGYKKFKETMVSEDNGFVYFEKVGEKKQI